MGQKNTQKISEISCMRITRIIDTNPLNYHRRPGKSIQWINIALLFLHDPVFNFKLVWVVIHPSHKEFLKPEILTNLQKTINKPSYGFDLFFQ